MIADSLIYLKEYNEITAKNRNGKNFDTSDEFLSGLQKSDRLHPVISLCIYYGKEEKCFYGSYKKNAKVL